MLFIKNKNRDKYNKTMEILYRLKDVHVKKILLVFRIFESFNG